MSADPCYLVRRSALDPNDRLASREEGREDLADQQVELLTLAPGRQAQGDVVNALVA